MRIMLLSEHRYPAAVGGRSGAQMYDNLAKGLSEIGHDVYYCLGDGAAIPLPGGANLVSTPLWDVDVWHLPGEGTVANEADVRGMPWLRTCHVDLALWNMDRLQARDNWVFVSKTLADSYSRDRYVLNGIDPAEFLYLEKKDDYILFTVGGVECAEAKGFDIALTLSQKMGFPLKVAGTCKDSSRRC